MVRSSVGERVLPGVRFDLFPLKFSRSAHQLASAKENFPPYDPKPDPPSPPGPPTTVPSSATILHRLGCKIGHAGKAASRARSGTIQLEPPSERGTHPRPGPLSAMP